MEQSTWSNAETFFWREETCFPSLGLFFFFLLRDFDFFIAEYKVDLEFNDLETEDDNFEEERMVLPGTLTVEDIR